MSQLRQHAEAEACDLCRLIWITCQRSRSTGNDTVLLERTESYLKINGTASHKLSIFRSSGKQLTGQQGFEWRRWTDECAFIQT